MRIILSRKGTDSDPKNGGIPSLVVDHRMISLPIPTDEKLVKYSALHCGSYNLGRIIGDLSKGRIPTENSAHLDPDLNPKVTKRPRGWRPLFGQGGAAASHLKTQGVTIGDLFLFFGWFQAAQQSDGKFRYERSASFHALFGWLQVGAVVDCADSVSSAFLWARSHPHFSGGYGTVYIAGKRLKLDGKDTGLPGAGIFREFQDNLRLTWPNRPRSVWRMPRWFFPRNGYFPLTYHVDKSRYRKVNGYVELQTVAKGQEFVLNGNEYPEAITWARKLIENGSRNS